MGGAEWKCKWRWKWNVGVEGEFGGRPKSRKEPNAEGETAVVVPIDYIMGEVGFQYGVSGSR